jgi:hypothetical protein
MSKGFDHGTFSDFVRALAFASRKHSQQRRKDADASPYINRIKQNQSLAAAN